NTGYTTGGHNRLTSDGTYNYTYDSEGNVLTKTNISTSESVEYTWDHRNRLTKVTFKNSGGTATKIVEYAYDHGQRWVRKTLDTNADGTIESSQVFVHDNGQIVLDFQKTGTAAASNSDLANRYLWGTNVDELLADELVDDGSEDDNRWALTDHLNSVRDLVVYNPVSGTVSVVKHVAYDAFGNVTSDSATAVKSLFLYTARPFDADTDLQNNLNRWYDLSTGRWMSVDPIGFEAGDVNLYRYVGNTVVSSNDPSGLLPGFINWLIGRLIPKPGGSGGIGGGDLDYCDCRYRSHTQVEVFVALNTTDANNLQLVYSYNADGQQTGFGLPRDNVRYISFKIVGTRPSKKRCDAHLAHGIEPRVHLNKKRSTGTPALAPLEVDGVTNDLTRIDVITWWTYVGC
ncbi:MAG: RHS repeat-associated core domain-containing protein, partial [Chloroflexi bacterium]|nr:RHS repeat-associated core domain-containing protein [Chloroflexota bacterium]